ncbi:MAG TPA: crossover junction endodeoxyribonuclease RuvC [Nitrospinota bacterium]|nr:crossover junction endodeoxyribonuclease RuvC [Nitrospinota bacterium]
MRVLGIDPGSSVTGYGIVDELNGSISAVTWGTIRTSNRLPFPKRLKTIHDGLTEIIKKYSPDVASIENLFFAENAKSALKLGQVRGAAILSAANQSIEVAEYTPLEIKQAISGYGRADKGQIQNMVSILLNLNEIPKPFDASDALAIAICHINTSALKIRLKNDCNYIRKTNS